jgi:hypothetical protein
LRLANFQADEAQIRQQETGETRPGVALGDSDSPPNGGAPTTTEGGGARRRTPSPSIGEELAAYVNSFGSW